MFRNLDTNGDWQFGNGFGSYVVDEQEIAVNLKTRILSFLGDCFFAINEGIDWWNLLDYRYQDRLENAVQEVVKNTPGVTAINSIDVLIGAGRRITIHYDIQTIYSQSYIDEVEPIAA
ncbi:MAG: hypothetical protein II244_06640 [Clostridia bacterium]|nr:hypothetical protein [Clostridia bacterium]